MRNKDYDNGTVRQAKTTGASSRTPKLRFPEFRDGGEWEAKKLINICDINPDGEELPQHFFYIDLESVVDGKLALKTKIFRDDAPIRAQRLLKNGDVIYQTVRPYQKNNLFCEFDDKNKYVASTGYAQLRAYDCNKFLYQILHTDIFVNSVILKCNGSSYPAINTSDLAKIIISFPQLPEQQKIADCLFSLDNLISAQTQKLDALKAHKKGLMQQLFPAEGENAPKLRFLEFHGSWIKRKLGEIAFIINAKAGDKKHVLMSVVSGVGLVSQNEKFGREIAGNQYKNYFVINKNDFAYNKSATKEYPEGFIAMYSSKNTGAVPNSIFTCFRVHPDRVLAKYLDYQFWNNLHGKWIKKYITVGARVHGSLNIDNNDLLLLPVPIPDGELSLKEQQKIADCLSFLDNLINAHTQKLDTLKTLKKGLMQQLFP